MYQEVMTEKRKQLLEKSEIERSLTRLAHEMTERLPSIDDMVLIGIRTRGEFIATRLAKALKKISAIIYRQVFWTLLSTGMISANGSFSLR